MKRIYLDYAASTPVEGEVLEAMLPYFTERFGNPGSLHRFGQEAIAAVDSAREKIAEALGATPPAGGFREIIFTGSASESNNLVLRGLAKRFIERDVVLRNIPQARQLRASQSDDGAPRGKKVFPLEKNYSGSEIQLSRNKIVPKIIVSAIEHESVLDTAKDLEREGIEVAVLKVDKNGMIDLAQLEHELNERTILVSIMYANNEIGTIQRITEIANIIRGFRERPTFSLGLSPGRRPSLSPRENVELKSPYPFFHTDAVQAFQYLDCNVKKLGVDFMTLSAHKIYGPKGIGMLYVKNPSKVLAPMITGGGQEFGLRSGTENVPNIVGFQKALELVEKYREREIKRMHGLKNYFWKELKKIYPKVQINGVFNKGVISHKSLVVSLPNILNIYFPRSASWRTAEELLIDLDIRGVAVSSGAACSARSSTPSHVLLACGYSNERARSSLRFSFGRMTTKEELTKTLAHFKKIL